MSDFSFGQVPPPEVDRELISPDEILPPGEKPKLVDESDAPDASEAQVRAMMAGLGGIVSFAIGNREIENHWRFTADELDDLQGPLTRMVNASPRLKAIVARSDVIALGLTLTRYGLRNADDQRRWARDHADEPDEVQAASGGGGAAVGAAGAAGSTPFVSDAANTHGPVGVRGTGAR